MNLAQNDFTLVKSLYKRKLQKFSTLKIASERLRVIHCIKFSSNDSMNSLNLPKSHYGYRKGSIIELQWLESEKKFRSVIFSGFQPEKYRILP